jgi:glucosylceramidase
MVTAAQNPDGSVAVVILNMNPVSKNIRLSLGNRSAEVQISAQALQTIVVTD